MRRAGSRCTRAGRRLTCRPPNPRCAKRCSAPRSRTSPIRRSARAGCASTCRCRRHPARAPRPDDPSAVARRLMAGLGLAGAIAFGAAALCLGGGCSDLGYYQQAVAGHLRLMASAKPVPEWLSDPGTTPALKARLEAAQAMREFAVKVLKLPDNPSYRSYADLHRPAAVWNVVAAPALSLELKQWCYPVLGCVSYRGYFDQAQAQALAERLNAQGLDVGVYGVPAYSTLGWSNWLGGDPLLNTFVDGSNAELARLMFHELAHQKLYVADDTEFNESFATAVARIGTRLWLDAHGDAAERERFAAAQRRRADFRDLTGRCRRALAEVYASALSDDDKRRAKHDRLTRLRADYAALKAGPWGGYSGYDAWFAGVNNATLGVLGTYTDLAGAFERLFEREGGDFDRFYAEAERIARLPKDERHATLRAIR